MCYMIVAKALVRIYSFHKDLDWRLSLPDPIMCYRLTGT
jgi:hypothetical protein